MARTDISLTQAEAAERLGVNRITLNRIENGKANVSLELLERMTVLYQRSRDWLCGDDDLVDPIDAAREQVAEALTKIGDGLEEIADIVEVLNGQVREKAQVAA